MFEKLIRRVAMWRVKRRREKLMKCYRKEFKIRHNKSSGLSPILYSYYRADDEGVMTIEPDEDGDLVKTWKWPENAHDVDNGDCENGC